MKSPASSLSTKWLRSRICLSSTSDDKVVTFAELAAAVRVHVVETPLEQLEDELGWELGEALADPAAFAEFSLDGLADIAAPLGLDWRHLLPLSRRLGG